MFEVADRHEVIRKINQLVYDETPYILLWHISYVRLLYWNRYGMPDHVLGKYTDEWASVDYWWNDTLPNDDLKAAMAAGIRVYRPLPATFISTRSLLPPSLLDRPVRKLCADREPTTAWSDSAISSDAFSS